MVLSQSKQYPPRGGREGGDERERQRQTDRERERLYQATMSITEGSWACQLKQYQPPIKAVPTANQSGTNRQLKQDQPAIPTAYPLSPELKPLEHAVLGGGTPGKRKRPGMYTVSPDAQSSSKVLVRSRHLAVQ